MTWFELLGLVITGRRSLLAVIKPKLADKFGPIAQEVYDLIEAGLANFERAHQKAVDLDEFESLRTEKQW